MLLAAVPLPHRVTHQWSVLTADSFDSHTNPAPDSCKNSMAASEKPDVVLLSNILSRNRVLDVSAPGAALPAQVL